MTNWLAFPLAIALGFVSTYSYMPSTASGPLAGCLRIGLIALGSAIAYYWKFR